MMERIPAALPPATEGYAQSISNKNSSAGLFEDCYREAESDYKSEPVNDVDTANAQISNSTTAPNVSITPQKSGNNDEQTPKKDFNNKERPSNNCNSIGLDNSNDGNNTLKPNASNLQYANTYENNIIKNNKESLVDNNKLAVNTKNIITDNSRLFFKVLENQMGLPVAFQANEQADAGKTEIISNVFNQDLNLNQNLKLISIPNLNLTDDAKILTELSNHVLKIQLEVSPDSNFVKLPDLVTNINHNNVIEQKNSLIKNFIKDENETTSTHFKSNEYREEIINHKEFNGEYNKSNNDINKDVSNITKLKTSNAKGNPYFLSFAVDKYISTGKLFTNQPKDTLSLNFQDVKPMEFTQRTLQILNNISGNGIGTARLILKPPSLGTIFVEFTLDKSLLKLNIKADSPEVVRIIESQIAILKEKLAYSGIKTESVEVRLKENYDGFKGNLQHYFNKKHSENKDNYDLKRQFAESFRLLSDEKKLDEKIVEIN